MYGNNSVKVTVNGHSNPVKAVEEILNQVKGVAKETVETSASFHLNKAIDNVHNAYTTAGFPKISGYYARWLAVRDPRFKTILPANFDLLEDVELYSELDKLARQIYGEKTSMISGIQKPGPSLLEGLRVHELQESRTSVSRLVVSDAPYSHDLERGYLFGKYRGASKQRPFFTGHTTTTKMTMLEVFMESLRRTTR